jgi:hypothetical protein
MFAEYFTASDAVQVIQRSTDNEKTGIKIFGQSPGV